MKRFDAPDREGWFMVGDRGFFDTGKQVPVVKVSYEILSLHHNSAEAMQESQADRRVIMLRMEDSATSVHLSIEDSGPMMINESIMCGTPVVCFDMGVARDLVHTGRTGYRAALRDSSDLAFGIREVGDRTRPQVRRPTLRLNHFVFRSVRQLGLLHRHLR